MHYKLRGTGQILKAIFLSILMILVLSEFAYARVTGVCSNCHTMHNSQNGSNMRLDYSKAQITGSGAGECLDCHAETRAVLLQLDCLGCHATNPSGGSNIIGGWPQIARQCRDRPCRRELQERVLVTILAGITYMDLALRSVTD